MALMGDIDIDKIRYQYEGTVLIGIYVDGTLTDDVFGARGFQVGITDLATFPKTATAQKNALPGLIRAEVAKEHADWVTHEQAKIDAKTSNPVVEQDVEAMIPGGKLNAI